MERTIEITGESLGRFFYAFTLAALLLTLSFVVLPSDSFATVLVAFLVALVVAMTVVSLWRRRTDGSGYTHLGAAEDIAWQPYADPGQGARDRWEKAIRRLHDEKDERD